MGCCEAGHAPQSAYCVALLVAAMQTACMANGNERSWRTFFRLVKCLAPSMYQYTSVYMQSRIPPILQKGKGQKSTCRFCGAETSAASWHHRGAQLGMRKLTARHSAVRAHTTSPHASRLTWCSQRGHGHSSTANGCYNPLGLRPRQRNVHVHGRRAQPGLMATAMLACTQPLQADLRSSASLAHR